VDGVGNSECDNQALSVQDLSTSIGGARVRYLRAGAGPALLLIHGLLGYSFSWRYAIPSLARISTVYAPDLPGAGYSDPVPGMDCCFRACAERVLGFLDAVGIRDCDLLGTSHGGAVAMMTAAMARSRVRRLILVDPVNPWSARGRSLSVFLSSPIIAPLFRELLPRSSLLQRFYFRRLFADTNRIRPGTLEGYLKPLRRPGALGYGLAILRSWNRDLDELESALARISDTPTLVVWGKLDAAVDPRSAFQLQQKLRNSELVILDGVGHLPYEEVPEQFNRIVSGFLLSSQSSPSKAAHAIENS